MERGSLLYVNNVEVRLRWNCVRENCAEGRTILLDFSIVLYATLRTVYVA